MSAFSHRHRLALWSLRLATADLRVAGMRTSLEVAGIGLTLGLMTLLWGLQSGIVNGFAAEQLDTPEATRIFVSGFDVVSSEQIEWIAAQPETGFVQPVSSYINSRVSLAAGAHSVDALMLPAGPGDPYLASAESLPGPDTIVLGEDVAEALGAGVGDSVVLDLPQLGSRGAQSLSLSVIATATTGKWYERAVLMDPSLIAAVDRRGFDSNIVFDGSASAFGLTPDDGFPGIRLYAASLDSVAPLVRKLNVLGWNARSRERLIAERRALEKAVSIVFALVFAVSFVALAISIVFGLINRALRLAGPLTALRAAGMAYRAVWGVPLAQGAILAALGWALAAAILRIGEGVINHRLPVWLDEFGITGPPVVAGADVYLAMGVGCLVLSLFASMIAIAMLPRSDKLSVSHDN